MSNTKLNNKKTDFVYNSPPLDFALKQEHKKINFNTIIKYD